ncbi:MAG: SIMPL domain-containing protein, partial [Candidatus Pacebacteria bacterium]|nr:SIMPL domain-containing protein [Candidatus Paceibacterota bacterium]
TKINDIIAYLKEQGVEEKDIKTSGYYLNPRYRYEEQPCSNPGLGAYDMARNICPPAEQVQDGFDVSQSIDVKVRDTAKAGVLIAGVGEKGATNLSGLNFIVDDTSAVKAEARTKAVADAKAKAEKLAADLGVTLVRITSYYENEGYYPEPYYAKAEMSADMGSGFGGAEMPVGEAETKVQVNISYEVR